MIWQAALRLAVMAWALVGMASAQVASALVCGIAPEVPGVIERTIDGEAPMGGDYDIVVLAVIVAIGPTDADGYRDADLDVGVVLRGSAPRDYHVMYPAAMDEPRVVFRPGATYLIAIESVGITGGPTTGPCSATKRIIETEEIGSYIALAEEPTIYRTDLPVPRDEPEGIPAAAVLALITAVLAASVSAWIVLRRRKER